MMIIIIIIVIISVIVIIMHLSMWSQGGRQGMGWDLIVFVGPGVGRLTNLVLPGEGIFKFSSPDMGPTWGRIWQPTWTKETETEQMFPHLHASGTRPTVWKDLEIMEANENKPKVGGFYGIDQLNLLRYSGMKVNGSKEKPSRFLQVQLISVWLTFATITV